MLEIGSRACRCTKRRWIEQAPPHGKEREAKDTAADLEPPRVDVLVRQAIAREVEDRPNK